MLEEVGGDENDEQSTANVKAQGEVIAEINLCSAFFHLVNVDGTAYGQNEVAPVDKGDDAVEEKLTQLSFEEVSPGVAAGTSTQGEDQGHVEGCEKDHSEDRAEIDDRI